MAEQRSHRYRTVQGDTFDLIAWRIWHREHMARLIIEANPAHADVVIFGPGVELRIPDAEVAPDPKDLPPWYGRGASDGGAA